MPKSGSYEHYQQRSGLGNVGSYQVAGHPWLTGSAINGAGANNGEVFVDFPRVPRSFTIINRSTGSGADSNKLIVHLDSRVNPDVITYNHYITLGRNDSYGFDIRTKRVYLSSKDGDQCAWEMHAELTGISILEMYNLSGSGVNSRD